MSETYSADEYFAIIPEWVLYSEITPQAIRLYCVLRRFADQGGECFPSRRTLANRLNVDSTKPVDRALKELEKIGAVTIEQRRDEKGDLTTNLYTVVSLNPNTGRDEKVPRWGHKSPKGGDANVPRGRDENVPYNESQYELEPIELERLQTAERLANLLADLIESNGNKRPSVTKKWILTIDRMMRLDERTEEEVEGAIRWSQKDEFWLSNILSPEKLRKHFDRMRMQARTQNSKTQTIKDWLMNE